MHIKFIIFELNKTNPDEYKTSKSDRTITN